MDIGKIFGYGIIVAELVSLTAYIPQYLHLLKIKDSTGISVTSWWLWFVCNFIYLIYGIFTGDIYLIIAFSIAVLENIIMIILTYKYKRSVLSVNEISGRDTL